MLNPSEPPLPIGAALARLDPGLFREGMSRVPAAVHVVTTDGPAGRAGLTATAMTTVTDDPPSLLICVNAAGRSAQALVGNGVFCVNTLCRDDIALADVFAGRAELHGRDRFTVGRWGALATGAPLLATSPVAFDCRLSDLRLVATHYVAIGEVVAIHLGAKCPALLYGGRAYQDR
jgi:flavin reductase (DIM6/NTAB) family NADH-FMN oxidoreductase RutF